MQHESDGYTNCNWCSCYSIHRIGISNKRLRNKRTNGDHPKYRIIEIDQNTEKNPEDFRRLSETQNTARNYRLTLVWNIQGGVTIIIIIDSLKVFVYHSGLNNYKSLQVYWNVLTNRSNNVVACIVAFLYLMSRFSSRFPPKILVSFQILQLLLVSPSTQSSAESSAVLAKSYYLFIYFCFFALNTEA